MTNKEFLLNIDSHKLAQYLIHIKTEDIYDYDIEDNYLDTGFDEIWYVTPDGEEYMDEEEAIEYTIKWLNQEHIDKED